MFTEEISRIIIGVIMKLLITVWLFLYIPLQVLCQTYPSGSGTFEDPYLIENLSNLKYLSDRQYQVTNPPIYTPGLYFLQTADIDASETITWNDGDGFRPIGNASLSFEGNYDGQGYVISNLFINQSGNYCGLFGRAAGANISNIVLKDVSFSGYKHVGGLVGYATSRTIVSNCSTSGTIFASGDISVNGVDSFCGGIIGTSNNRSEIINCSSTVELSGVDKIGGITAFVYNDCKVLNSYYIGNITGRNFIGGIVGFMNGLTTAQIKNCYSVANINYQESSFCGSLIGENGTSSIESCYFLNDDNFPAIGHDNTPTSFDSSNFQGLTENELKTSTSYISDGWDFLTTWSLLDPIINNGYPYLYWQEEGQHSLIVIDDENTQNITAPDLNVEIDFTSALPTGTQLLINLHDSNNVSCNGLSNSQETLGSNFWRVKTTCTDSIFYNLKLDLNGIQLPTDLEEVKIFKREDANSDWVDVVDLGAEVTWLNNTVSISGLSSFSDFIPVLEDATLPVELSTFTGDIIDNETIKLSWSVESESNLLGYYLMRSNDINLANAEVIPSLIQANNSSQTHTYSFIDHPQANNKILYYWLKSVELSNQSEYYGPVQIILNDESDNCPQVIYGNQLNSPFPNPFNPTTTISFSLAKAQNVELKIYNIKGQVVRNLLTKFIEEANIYHTVTWDGKDNSNKELSSGTYIINMKLDKELINRKAILMK